MKFQNETKTILEKLLFHRVVYYVIVSKGRLQLFVMRFLYPQSIEGDGLKGIAQLQSPQKPKHFVPHKELLPFQ